MSVESLAEAMRLCRELVNLFTPLSSVHFRKGVDISRAKRHYELDVVCQRWLKENREAELNRNTEPVRNQMGNDQKSIMNGCHDDDLIKADVPYFPQSDTVIVDYDTVATSVIAPEGNQSNTCAECGESFRVRAELSRHLRVHRGRLPDWCNDGPPHKCCACPKIFRNKSHLIYHVRRAHYDLCAGATQLFACAVCSRTFTSHARLEAHELRHVKCTDEGGPFRCALCTRVYTLRENLSEHMRVRHAAVQSAKIIKCRYCDRKYERTWRLEKHIELCHADKVNDSKAVVQLPSAQISALVNEATLTSTQVNEAPLNHTLDDSLKVESDLMQSIRDIVGPTINGDDKEMSHEIDCDSDDAIKNEKVTNIFKSPGDPVEQTSRRRSGRNIHKLERHSLRDVVRLKTTCENATSQIPSLPDWCNTGPPYVCLICEKSFKTKSHVVYHARRAHPTEFGAALHPCHICDKSFVSQALLDRHVTQHSLTPNLAETPYRCKQCRRAFTTVDGLNGHLLEVHHRVDDVFSCTSCLKTYVSQWRLDRHVRLVHARAGIVVGDGGLEAGDGDKIKVKIENGNAVEEDARRDIYRPLANESHESRRVHKCSSCTKSFNTKSHLSFHVRQVHPQLLGDDIVLYKCHLCSRSFISQSRLDKHTALHTECTEAGGPFQCPLCTCTRLYATRDNLDAHVRARHSCVDVVYPCVLCPKTYVSQWRLDRHVKLTHDGEDMRGGGVTHNGEDMRNGADIHNGGDMHNGGVIHNGRDVCKKTTVGIERNDFGRDVDTNAPYVCCECFSRFNVRDEILLHFSQCLERDFKDKPTSNESLLLIAAVESGDLSSIKKESGLSDASGWTYLCDVCQSSFPSQKELDVHVRTHSDSGSYDCHLCSEHFVRRYTLKRHLRLTHNALEPGRFACTVCGKRYERMASLYCHAKTHSRDPNGRRAFSCNICDQQFNYRSLLTEHMRVHTGERPFTCEICGKTFAKKQRLRAHVNRHASAADRTLSRQYRCPICGNSFSEKSNLNVHVRNVHGNSPPERRYMCPTCGLGFVTSTRLKYHYRTHTGEKPYACVQCGRCYTKSNSLRLHMRIHSGEKPFTCAVCGKTFRLGATLKKHTRVHTHEIVASCLTCGKGFSQKSNLRTHMRMHTGEKPFACTLCELQFTYSDGLKKHLAAYHASAVEGVPLHTPLEGVLLHPAAGGVLLHPDVENALLHPLTEAALLHPPVQGVPLQPKTEGALLHPSAEGVFLHPPADGALLHASADSVLSLNASDPTRLKTSPTIY